MTTHFEPSFGADKNWKDNNSPLKGFDINEEHLKNVDEHKMFCTDKMKENNRSIWDHQCLALKYNRVLKDMTVSKNKGLHINRLAHVGKESLVLAEEAQELCKMLLAAYDDCIHDLQDMKDCNETLFNRCEELGGDPEYRSSVLNPSEGEEEHWSPEGGNVNDEAPVSSVAVGRMDVDNNNNDDDDDKTELMVTPVRSTRARALKSDSPSY